MSSTLSNRNYIFRILVTEDSDAEPLSAPECYDFVVVGAGSAGCVVAGRLAEANRGSVLLLEIGDPATAHPETLSADGFKDAFANDDVMWHRMSEPQDGCGRRRLYAGSGRVAGGSGAVNGMVYTRGDQADFRNWPEGWSWDDVAPVYAALESRITPQTRSATRFSERCVAAALACGFQRKDGLNDGDLADFVGYNAMNYRAGQRNSSYRQFVRDRESVGLSLICRARVRRLLCDDKGRAYAVECLISGQAHLFEARQEIVLCAGALETPRLLLLSGIGPGAHLAELGIPLVHDAPGIGNNLQDHPNVCLFYRSRAAVDFAYPQLYGFARAGSSAKLTGPDSCYVFYAAPASIRQSMQRMLPIILLPRRLYERVALRQLIRKLIDLAFALRPVQRFVDRLFGIVVILGKPQSRGRIRLSSADPDAPARIDLAYYQDETDRQTMLAALARARTIAASPPLREVGAHPLSAGGRARSAKQIWAWVRRATMTTFHYCGTCRMGTDDASPVDPQLRLKGIRGLRIADASVIPEIPVSALNAPSMMIGYRVVDFILADQETSA